METPSSSSSLLLLILSLFLARQVSAECTCESQTEPTDKSKALGYKLIAIFSILTSGAVGVCIPIFGKKVPALSPDNNIFFLIKSFAAGVILATGFIHILPDAFENLMSPCLGESPWGSFPFAGFIAMVSAIVTMMIDAFATSYYQRSHFNKPKLVIVGGVDEEKQHEGHVHGHVHGPSLVSEETTHSISIDLMRHRVVTQVLEMGIVVHSVIIGVSLGASESPETIKPLVAALTFHQLFEGMGLGGCISQAKFEVRAIVAMVLYFSLTTPVGIAVGMGISNSYQENSPKSLIVEGVLNSASAGILIYMALVDLIAADYTSPRMMSNLRLQLGSSVSLLLGCGCMSFLAKWA